ncbi:MAG TPA: hypothetical protein VGO93_09585 [Candidatus Xenobia bacterium]|jgi:hypothetical protein
MTTVPAISLAVVGVFLVVQGLAAARSGRFADGIVEGTPSRVLGGLCVAAGLGLLGGLYWWVNYHIQKGY